MASGMGHDGMSVLESTLCMHVRRAEPGSDVSTASTAALD